MSEALVHNTQNEISLLVDIRNTKDLEKYPQIMPVREAVICIYDFLVEARNNSREPRLVELSKDEIFNLGIALDLTVVKEPMSPENRDREYSTLMAKNEDLLNEAYWFYKATYGKCRTTSRGVAKYLSIKYPGKYHCQTYALSDGLKYFGWHEVLILTDASTGKKIGISPGNIINFTQSNGEESFGTFSLPTHNNQPICRPTTVVLSDTLNPILETFQSIECKHVNLDDWYETTNFTYPEDSYPAIDSKGKPTAVHISQFINDWKDNPNT